MFSVKANSRFRMNLLVAAHRLIMYRVAEINSHRLLYMQTAATGSKFIGNYFWIYKSEIKKDHDDDDKKTDNDDNTNTRNRDLNRKSRRKTLSKTTLNQSISNNISCPQSSHHQSNTRLQSNHPNTQSNSQSDGPKRLKLNLKIPKNKPKVIVLVLAFRSLSLDTLNQVYIHQPGQDKRYDCWISQDCLLDIHVSDTERAEAEKAENIDSDFELVRYLILDFDMSFGLKESPLSKLFLHHLTKAIFRNIDQIIVGRWQVDVWYHSPYQLLDTPTSFSKLSTSSTGQQSLCQVPCIDTLHLCPKCLGYFQSVNLYLHHTSRCSFTLDNKVYHKGDLKVFLVDGKTEKLFCQHLCLAAKLFLDHKTIMYDLEPFVFYVLVRMTCRDDDDNSDEIVGFFSKEKVSPEHHTLSCILVFPQYQQQGYGRLLIELSYEIYKKKGILYFVTLFSNLVGFYGGPERPLSDLGLRGYARYWIHVLLGLLYFNPNTILSVTLSTLSHITLILKIVGGNLYFNGV